ncbi:predicted protein [Histoplasma mississippiense (nom. inval.)]|uniref:predicted protein n=1 Tax=Ajellomyces capsulatus (strain NAm1 / WU24) TaxID=2059318 RepID=UPI000157D044|nr:predicted protein [Histoplasma mississippiense (nom. inval.)]EDN10831.1 predicted protein [Histoplasma mississippiense (nom. inval.)]
MLLRSWTSILGGFLLYYVNLIYTHDGHDYSNHEKRSIDRRKELLKKWDQEWSFSGVSTFAHLKHVKCLLEPDEHYDVAVLGVPFDTSVSFRPGARFGPRAIRAAKRQMYEAFLELGTREAPNPIPGISHGKPKIVTLGGDHSITLPFTENRSPCCTSMRTLIPGTPSGTRRIGHLINPASTTVAFFHTASHEGSWYGLFNSNYYLEKAKNRDMNS